MKFDWTINLSDMFAVVSGLVGVGVLWYKINLKVDRAVSNVTDLAEWKTETHQRLRDNDESRSQMRELLGKTVAIIDGQDKRINRLESIQDHRGHS